MKILRKSSLIVAGLAVIPSFASALPQNGSVAGGTASITQTSPAQLTIKQTSDRAVLDWQSFSIAKGETTTFNQPSASSVAVNRVTGVDPSQIAGNLTANGRVVLVNPNGIVFSQGAQVNVGGLIASTASISTSDAMAGTLRFGQAGSTQANITNAGAITAAQGGLVALVAPSVANSGTITAKLGKVFLASGSTWALDLYGDNLVSFAVDGSNLPATAGVSNTGTLSTDPNAVVPAQGAITLTIAPSNASNIVSSAINQQGFIQASNYWTDGKAIVLGGDGSNVYAGASVTAPQAVTYTYAQPGAVINQPGLNSSVSSLSIGEGETVSYVYNTWSSSVGAVINGTSNGTIYTGSDSTTPANVAVTSQNSVSFTPNVGIYTVGTDSIDPLYNNYTIVTAAYSSSLGPDTIGGNSSSLVGAAPVAEATTSEPVTVRPVGKAMTAVAAPAPRPAPAPEAAIVIAASPAPAPSAASGEFTLSQVVKTQIPVDGAGAAVTMAAYAMPRTGTPCVSARDCAATTVIEQGLR